MSQETLWCSSIFRFYCRRFLSFPQLQMLNFDVKTNRRISIRRKSTKPTNFSSSSKLRFDQPSVDKVINLDKVPLYNRRIFSYRLMNVKTIVFLMASQYGCKIYGQEKPSFNLQSVIMRPKIVFIETKTSLQTTPFRQNVNDGIETIGKKVRQQRTVNFLNYLFLFW